MERKDIHRILQQLKLVTKYGMTGICLLMTLHCGMLYFGVDLMLVHFLFWAFIMLIGIQLSRIFGLCWVHKLSIVYSMSVIFCVVLQKYGTFEIWGIDVHTMRGVMFKLGILMVVINIWKMTKKNC